MKARIERSILNRLLTRAVARGESFKIKQAVAGESYYYGDGGTIHDSGHVDVETFQGEVVSVWFRCSLLAFKQNEVEEGRAVDMRSFPGQPLSGVELIR